MNSYAYSSEDTGSGIVMDRALADIVFIGTRLHFPECLFRMIATEIDSTSCQRLAGPQELRSALANGCTPPQLVVVDETIWPHVGADLLTALHAEPRSAIAIAFRDAARVNRVVLANNGMPRGISFLPMDLNIESWLTILRLLLTGYPFLPSEIQLAQEMAPTSVTPHPSAEPQPSAFDKLTPREREVLALVAEGFQNKHIAERLELSEHTVKLHLHHVISKLGARNRTDAALQYRQQMGS